MSEEKKRRILELAKKCPSTVSRIVERFFTENPSLYDLNDLKDKIDGNFNSRTICTSIKDNMIPVLELYFFISNKSLSDRVDYCDETPLIFAIIYKRISIVSFLLELGADMEYSDYRGVTPVQCALLLMRTEIAQFLLFKKYNVILSDAIEMIKFLLDKRNEYCCVESYDGVSALLHYASRINADAFKMALSVSSVDDFYTTHPLYENMLINLIVRRGNKTILKAAVDHGVDLNFSGDPGSEPLYNAVVHRPKMIPILVKNGADLHSDRKYTLLDGYVCIYGALFAPKYAKSVKIFEICGVNVYGKLSNNENELHHICRYATYVKPFLILIERETDINHVNSKNWTPLKFVLEDDLYGCIRKEIPILFLVSILTKMEENKDFVCQGNIECLSDERVRSFHDRCKKEIDLLKKMKITESIYCFDFLTSDLKKLTTLAGDKELMRQFRLQKLYSLGDNIYGEHLKRSYERSIWRFKQMEKTFKIIKDWILPKVVFEKICGFLNDKELRMSKYYFTLLKKLLPKN